MMHPNKTEPLDTFGIDIREALTTVDNKVVLVDDIGLTIVEIDGTIWESERISWDGIKDVKVQGNLITGLSFDVMDHVNSWIAFSINLDNKEITGGSYRRY